VSESTVDNPYLRDAVLTATAEQLQLMLYDGAIKFALQGRDALEDKNFERSCDRLTRAQDIVLEMFNGLNHDVNPELCSRMASLYMFIYRKLIDANVQHDLTALDDAVKILRMERQTWQMVVDKVAAERAAGMTDTSSATAPASDGTAETSKISIEG